MTARKRLGHTTFELSPLGLGCWQFSNGKGLIGSYWKELGRDAVAAIVAASLAGGINWFDTAEAYGKGASEQMLAGALKDLAPTGPRLYIADKWWPTLRSASSIRTTIDERLARLTPMGIDLYQIHNSFSLSTTRAQMDAMAGLVAAGKIRAVGVSNFSARRMRAAARALARHGIALASNQVRYSLLDRRIERNGVLDAARELGVSIIAYSPLAQGLLSGRYHADPEAVRRLTGPRRMLPAFHRRGLVKTRPLIDGLSTIASAHGATAAQVALAWTVQFHRESIFAIPGATSAVQARDNAASMELELSADELSHLDRLARAIL
ncbi:MAG TPA: aldo/keto reductase [Thermoanaerobaculia bacterium]|nr:aldo/keto reductase [Thermoanaerobaculia bacterium]